MVSRGSLHSFVLLNWDHMGEAMGRPIRRLMGCSKPDQQFPLQSTLTVSFECLYSCHENLSTLGSES